MTKIFQIFILLCLLTTFLSCTKSVHTSVDLDKDPDILDQDIESDKEFPDDSEPETEDRNEIDDMFEDGPYGIDFGDTAGNFTIPTENGDWIFADNRNPDHSYIFIIYRPSNSISTSIWTTDIIKMMDSTPDNVHYFFLVDGTHETYAEKISELKKNIENGISITGNEQIKEKLHVADRPVREIDSWLNKWLDKHPDFFMGIDRFQKIREGGLFHSWRSSTLDPKFEFISKEAELYNYEYELDSFLENKSSVSTVIPAVDGVPFEGEGWVKELFFTIEIPELDSPGRFYLFLEQICESQKECEWDRLLQLFLCENETSDNCTTEIGRWITTYGRSGKWLTDISPLFPLIENPGKYRFRFTVNGDNYINHLDFIYIPGKEEAPNPAEVVPLYSGTVPFDENYNSHWEQLNIDIPASVNKVWISAFITGHGNGSEAENCAEFCKFESIFYVNGQPFATRFDNAGTLEGCLNLVSEGVVPNQFGSWPFGRAGWCPGQDVKLINIDITEVIKKGEVNYINYESLLNGKDYIPIVTDPSGYRAEIPLSSYLILWQQ